MSKNFLPIDQHIHFIREYVEKGGPSEEDWIELNDWIDSVGEHIRNQEYTSDEMVRLRKAFGEAFSSKTIQGFAYQKPHGYAGDFEIIDRLYTNYVCEDENLANWDIFTQKQSAVISIRNRKKYFKELLASKCASHKGQLKVLNVASGPCRDLLEFFNENPECDVVIDCLDQDKMAIEYASNLLEGHLDKVEFIKKNIFRFETDKKYDLIWSAGLFDYFEDKHFTHILNNLISCTNPDAEIVIGNFTPSNPTRNYLMLLDWILYYRDENDLEKLAQACGVPINKIRIGKESEKVNLFMHINC